VRPWLRLARAIDRLSEIIGRVILWLVGIMIVVGAFNAVARYAGRFGGTNLSSNAYIELQWYLFSLVFLLGAAYALKHDAHVRVDLLYGRLTPRGRAWIDLLGTILFLIPFSVLMLVVSWPSIRSSWQVREVSPDPGGLARYPIKTVILVAFVLLILQGISEAIKQLAVLRGAAPLPERRERHVPEEI
jgi:TRAP-type mannitol/chloroaromatic compound transport system permease small subunit